MATQLPGPFVPVRTYHTYVRTLESVPGTRYRYPVQDKAVELVKRPYPGAILDIVQWIDEVDIDSKVGTFICLWRVPAEALDEET